MELEAEEVKMLFYPITWSSSCCLWDEPYQLRLQNSRVVGVLLCLAQVRDISVSPGFANVTEVEEQSVWHATGGVPSLPLWLSLLRSHSAVTLIHVTSNQETFTANALRWLLCGPTAVMLLDMRPLLMRCIYIDLGRSLDSLLLVTLTPLITDYVCLFVCTLSNNAVVT